MCFTLTNPNSVRTHALCAHILHFLCNSDVFNYVLSISYGKMLLYKSTIEENKIPQISVKECRVKGNSAAVSSVSSLLKDSNP